MIWYSATRTTSTVFLFTSINTDNFDSRIWATKTTRIAADTWCSYSPSSSWPAAWDGAGRDGWRHFWHLQSARVFFYSSVQFNSKTCTLLQSHRPRPSINAVFVTHARLKLAICRTSRANKAAAPATPPRQWYEPFNSVGPVRDGNARQKRRSSILCNSLRNKRTETTNLLFHRVQ